MTIYRIALAAICIGSTGLMGCMATGDNLKGNVYKANQVNQAQNVIPIRIATVTAAKVEVDNSQGKKQAEIGGALLGAIIGGVVGNQVNGSAGSVVGAVGGGAAGGVAGSMVNDKILVDGVTITYRSGNRLVSSTQVGLACEFKPGEAFIISTSPTESRIQPNAECPKK